ncbi:hypothetical protein HJFPF1_08548 [Paramyrothecium foliicola]|nr:hypothetical protein HJFPF1_08548 [Paramyrothecium foliicola]
MSALSRNGTWRWLYHWGDGGDAASGSATKGEEGESRKDGDEREKRRKRELPSASGKKSEMRYGLSISTWQLADELVDSC